MSAKPAGGYAKFESRALRRLLRNPLAAVAMHWAFQSLFYMDATERRFKLLLDVALAAVGAALLHTWCSWPLAWALAFLAAHTLNFLFNGHLWGALKHYGLVSVSYEAFSSYAQGFSARAGRESSIGRVAVYGSLARQSWSPSSDLDVRLVRKPGLINGARACWFVLRERSRALIARFPLDAYVLDDDRSLQKLNPEEEPIDMTTQIAHATTREVAAEPKISTTRATLLAALGEIGLLLVCLLPGLFFSLQTLQEPWTMFRIARASLSVDAQRVLSFVTSGAGYRGEHIGGEMIQVGLLSATNLPLEALGLIPVGSLLLAILYYALSRQIAQSRWAAVAITIYASWYYPGLYSQFGTETYVWTNSLFLTFLILLLYWLRSRTPALSLLIMLVFTSTFLHYHTTPLWIIVAICTVIAALKLRDPNHTARSMLSWSLALFCIVLYFTFDTVLYGNGLARLRSEATGESFIQSFLSKIIAPLFATTPTILKPFEMAPINPRIATWSTLLVLLILSVPVGVWCLLKLYAVITSRRIQALAHNKYDIFAWVIVVVAIAHALIYSTYGSVSLRVIPLAFPLILPIVIRSFKYARKIELSLTFGLAICAIIGFMSFAPTLLPDTIASETGVSSKLIKPGSHVLADANTYGSLLLEAAEDGNLLDFTWLDSKTYASVVGQRPMNWDTFNYIAVDTSNKPIISSNWVFFEPWTRHVAEIDQNNQLDKIYDSENLMLFQERGAGLPDYRIANNDIAHAPEDTIGDTLRLFFAIILLLFIPGAIAVFAMHTSGFFRVNEAHTLIGLSIGMSITFVTFVGYIVNFTPLGLSFLVPLSIVAPWVLLGIYLLVRRPQVRLRTAWVVRGAAILVVVFCWAILASQVAQARTDRHAQFTEFFVTRANAQDRSFTVNVVNRLDQAEEFTIDIAADSVPIQTLGPWTMPPESQRAETWQAPSLAANTSFTVTLKKDGILYRELHFSGSGEAER